MSNPRLFRKAYVRVRKQTEIRKKNKVQSWRIDEFRPETRGCVFKAGNLSTATAGWGRWVLDSQSRSEASHLDRKPFTDAVTPQEAAPGANITQWFAEARGCPPSVALHFNEVSALCWAGVCASLSWLTHMTLVLRNQKSILCHNNSRWLFSKY